MCKLVYQNQYKFLFRKVSQALRDCPKICTVFTILSPKGFRWVGGLKKNVRKDFSWPKTVHHFEFKLIMIYEQSSIIFNPFTLCLVKYRLRTTLHYYMSPDPPPQRGSFETTTPTSIPSRNSKSGSLCVSARIRRYKQRGLSGQAAELLSRDIRNSTQKLYDSKLRVFDKWCRKSEIDIWDSTPEQFINFLTEKFYVNKYQFSTLSGYISAFCKLKKMLWIHWNLLGGHFSGL